MRWMLQAAGVTATGPRGELQVRGLLAVWLWGVRAWERDQSDDLSHTMAAVDTALQRAERVASWLHGQGRTPPAAAPGLGSAATGDTASTAPHAAPPAAMHAPSTRGQPCSADVAAPAPARRTEAVPPEDKRDRPASGSARRRHGSRRTGRRDGHVDASAARIAARDTERPAGLGDRGGRRGRTLPVRGTRRRVPRPTASRARKAASPAAARCAGSSIRSTAPPTTPVAPLGFASRSPAWRAIRR